MIGHKFIIGRSRTNFLQYKLEITTNSLQGDDLINVVNYLIDHIAVIYEKFSEMQEEVMWPIEINLNKQLSLTESMFWQLIFKNVSNPLDYLYKYSQTLCELGKTMEFEILLQSDEYQFHGGYAFNQYWLSCAEGPIRKRSEIIKSINVYNQWLRQNDLGSEVSQDDCINIIFEHYSHFNDLALATLLALRITNGQNSSKGFDYLHQVLVLHNDSNVASLLKKVLEQLLNEAIHPKGTNINEAIILELCAVVYGSNKECTEKILDYVKNIAKTELWPTQEFQMKKINYLRQVGDIYWQNVTSQDRYIDTSFHLFDTHTRKWIDYDERE